MLVYLIRQQNTNFYKIGISKDPKVRLNQLQTANSFTLELVETFSTKHNYLLENYVHKKFADANVQLEWFELSEGEVAQFQYTCKQGEANFDLLKDQNTFLQDRFESKPRKSYWL